MIYIYIYIYTNPSLGNDFFCFDRHHTRFNKPVPKITSPSQIVSNNQSMFAQQYYFNQLYHAMNQNISTMPEQQGKNLYFMNNDSYYQKEGFT